MAGGGGDGREVGEDARGSQAMPGARRARTGLGGASQQCSLGSPASIRSSAALGPCRRTPSSAAVCPGRGRGGLAQGTEPNRCLRKQEQVSYLGQPERGSQRHHLAHTDSQRGTFLQSLETEGPGKALGTEARKGGSARTSFHGANRWCESSCTGCCSRASSQVTSSGAFGS